MSQSFTLDDDHLLVCYEDAWPLLCTDEQLEQCLLDFAETGEFSAEGPDEARISSILSYSKALRITKTSSGDMPLEVVLN